MNSEVKEQGEADTLRAILFSQLTHFILHSHRNHSAALNLVIQLSFRTFYDLDQVFIQLDRPVPWIDDHAAYPIF